MGSSSRVVLLVALASILGKFVAAKGMKCYTCTSYMSQCRETVTNSPSDVYRAGCSSKCFIRQGEDGATYRGCFDDFLKVSHLRSDYLGCRNQTWNNRNLRWCFCDKDLCNGIEMESMDSHRISTPGNQSVEDHAHGHAHGHAHSLTHADTHTTTSSSSAPVLNSGHSIFKFLETEDVQPDAESHKKSRSRGDFKQLQSDDTYEAIEGYGRVGQHVIDLDHAVVEALDKDPKSAKQSIEPLLVPAPADLDYPFNQDFYSISRIIEELARRKKAESQAPSKVSVDKYRSIDVAFKEGTEDLEYGGHDPYGAPELNKHEEPTLTDIAAKMDPCTETGYYAHPSDCSVYMACVYEPRSRSATWHMMPCPGQLFWDDVRKICVEHSINCPTSGQQKSLTEE